MRSTYKKLGPYIREIDVRNVENRRTNLLGVSTQKVFMDSIANTVGTDFTRYKVVKRGQFTYVPDTSRRGDRIGLALLETHDWGLVSNVYTVFEIIDERKLLPEYLMMWFRRSEFDRYARFKSHGSVRELFGWDEMCDVELPIPSIERQREIVKEYRIVANRILLNNLLSEKLEETAQAVYRQWFVEFEFPMTAEYARSIGKPDLVGQPYKSSGGEMEYDEILEQEIPKSWEGGRLDSVCTISAGGDKPIDVRSERTEACTVPVYSNSTINEGLFGYTQAARITEKCVTVSARGGVGFTAIRLEPFVPIVRLIVAVPKQSFFLGFLYRTLKRYRYDSAGSAQDQLTVPHISQFPILKPPGTILNDFQDLDITIAKLIKAAAAETSCLARLSNVLLSRVSLVRNGAGRGS